MDSVRTFRTLLWRAVLLFLAFSAPAFAQSTVQEWQARAVQEYPALATPDSELNLKFRARLAELRKSNPAFFNDPSWPYTLAKSLDPKAPLIPGVDLTTVPAPAANPPGASPAPAPAPAPYRSARVESTHGPATMHVYSAQTVADLVPSHSLDTPQGQTICLEGTIARQYFDTIAAPGRFYIILAPNVACEFRTEGFVTDNSLYISKFSSAGPDRLDVRLKEDQVTLYQAMGYHSWGYSYSVNKGYKAIKPILLPGEQITIVGQVEGFGKIGAGLNDCVILRNCAVRRIYDH